MAILERTLTGDFTTILTELDAVVKQSVSATLEGSSDFNFSTAAVPCGYTNATVPLAMAVLP